MWTRPFDAAGDGGSLPLHVDDQAEYRFNALVNVRRVRPPSGSGTGTLFWLEQGPAWTPEKR